MRSFITSLSIAVVAMSFAKGVGIPAWIDGWTFGDQFDIGVLSFMATWNILEILNERK